MLASIVKSSGLPATKTGEFFGRFQGQGIRDCTAFYACKRRRVERLAEACKMGIETKKALFAEWEKG